MGLISKFTKRTIYNTGGKHTCISLCAGHHPFHQLFLCHDVLVLMHLLLGYPGSPEHPSLPRTLAPPPPVAEATSLRLFITCIYKHTSCYIHSPHVHTNTDTCIEIRSQQDASKASLDEADKAEEDEAVDEECEEIGPHAVLAEAEVGLPLEARGGVVPAAHGR